MKELWNIVVIFVLRVKYLIHYKLWCLTGNEALFKQFGEELYHRQLLKRTLEHLKHSDKYGDWPSSEENSLFVGVIANDWKERINKKIAEKEKE